MIKLWSTLLCSFILFSLIAADKPAVIWYSTPVNPGEAVMVFGGPWKQITKIELNGPEKQIVKPLKVTEDCVTFVYPAKWPLAVFNANIVDGKYGSVNVRINTPDVWWIQGNAGKNASPGGWIRAFGRCIGYNNQAVMEFRAKGKKTKIRAVKSDLYSAKVKLPDNFPLGDYAVYINNGLDKNYVAAGNIKVVGNKVPWSDKIFSIAKYGAIPNDQNDDSRAINAALVDIEKNNGGILYIPRGRFGMQGELKLPPNTLLRGANMSLSQIYWPDDDYPSGALISGKYNFGIEEIFLVSGNFANGIITTKPGKNDNWKNKNILINKVRTSFLHTDSINNTEGMRRFLQTARVLNLSGSNIHINNCDFIASKGGFKLRGEYLFVHKNRFVASSGNQCLWLDGKFLIFEENDCEGTSSSLNNNSRFLYLYKNILGGIFGNGDRETFTFDGGGGTYNNKIISVNGLKVKLKKFGWRHGANHWINRSIYIIGGRGAGQMRYITATAKNEVEIDHPWEIQPDKTSHVVIANTRNKLMYIDNTILDGNPFQLYGCAVNVILAENKLYRNGGLPAYGMDKGGIPEPSWFIQFLDNQIMEGNSVRGPWSYIIPANDSYLAFFDRGIRKPLTYSQVRVGIMRRNKLHSNAYIYVGRRVKDALIENNLVKNADKGTVIGTESAVLRGNRFENVISPHVVNTKTKVDPVESVLAALQAAKTTLKAYLPEDWDKYSCQVKVLARQKKTEDTRKKAVFKILTAALRNLSAKVGNNIIPAATVKALIGLDFSQKTPWMFSRLKSAKMTKLYISSAYPIWNSPAKLSAKVESFKDWTINLNCPKLLIPGKNTVCSLYVKPANDLNTPFVLSIEYKITGKNWSFKFKENYSRNSYSIKQFLVAGPFKNTSGSIRDTNVHPPEIDLNVARSYATTEGKRSWVVVKSDKRGIVDLSKVFKKTEMSTAHAVAIVRAAKPMLVRVKYGINSSSFLFVNGKRVGSSARRDGVMCVHLKKGNNLFQLITSHCSGKWPLEIKLTVVDPVKPGDIVCLPGKELFKSPLLLPQGEKIVEGKNIPHSMDIDWKLIYNDKFDRFRLGNGWKCTAPGWMTQKATIADGKLIPENRWGYLTYDKNISTPVRIEFDMIYSKSMAGVILCPKGLSYHTFWYKLIGRGYCMSIGWHNLRNNRVVRNTETVLLDEKASDLEEGNQYHITAQFVPPYCKLYVNNKLYLEYKDPSFLLGLNRIGIFTIGKTTFDNIRIYVQNGKNAK